MSIGQSLSEVMAVRWVPIPAFTRWDVKEEVDEGEADARDGGFELQQQEPGDKPRGKANRETRTREGMLRRQCTKEVKVVPIVRYIKEEVLGIRRGYPVKKRVRSMMGFSAEEVFRVKPDRETWITSTYPLMDARIFRPECIRIVVERAGLGTPRKSACVFCPYHSDRYWAEMKRDDPQSFEKACRVDEMIRTTASRDQLYRRDDGTTTQANVRVEIVARDGKPLGRGKDGIAADEIFVHRSCRPLREVHFGDQPALWDEECEGHCGI